MKIKILKYSCTPIHNPVVSMQNLGSGYVPRYIEDVTGYDESIDQF